MARTLILSDTHLGSTRPGSAPSAESLRPLWRACDRLVINGDVAEVHDSRYRERAVFEAARLADLCRRDGVELTLLTGNHDACLAPERRLLLAGGQVFVTHGDVFHPDVAPWSREAPTLRQAFAQSLGRLTHPARRLDDQLVAAEHAHLEHWTDHEPGRGEFTLRQVIRRPWLPLKLLWCWARYPRLAAEFTRRHVPGARFVVFGHTHRAGCWRRGGVTVINTGCFGFPSRPLAVQLHGCQLEVWPIRSREGSYELGPRPIHRYPLESRDPAAAPQAPARRATDRSLAAEQTREAGAA
jgi:predicted phosphodiesterase